LEVKRDGRGSFRLLVVGVFLAIAGGAALALVTLPPWPAGLAAAGFVLLGAVTGLAIRRLLAAARDRDASYRSLLETTHDAIFLMHRYRFVDCNTRTLEMYGCRQDQIIGQTPYRFSPPRQPDGSDSTAAAQRRIQAALAGRPQFFEWVHLRLDGSPFDAEVSLSRVDIGGRPMLRAVVRDISARKAAERERSRLEQHLRQAQKLEAVGTLAGGLAHDFNNLLQGVRGYADLLLLDLPAGATGRDKLEEIASAADRGAALTRRLLTFSRRVESQREPLDLNALIRGLGRLLERTVPRMVAIDLDLAEDLPAIEADRSQLEQVLMNLAVNARDAMPEGGRLTITTGRQRHDPAGPEAVPELGPGLYVLLQVADSGSGMSAEVAEHAFEPFFSTKGPDAGSGLGLAMVYGIVRSHGGAIQLSSRPGAGTRFRILLPAGTEQARPAAAPTADEPRPGGDETVLLVDDEASLLRMLRDLLERHGYRVLTAASGEAALVIYRDAGAAIDLVILDQNMPGMGGARCLETLRALDEEVRVLVLSGHRAGRAELLERGAREALQKPAAADALLHTVRRVLD
jgi:PAS domain S-box-containing protein